MNPLAHAIAIAALAHENDVDKAGAPYILHPLRMMTQMTSDEARMTAVLHDVVEDHLQDGWTFDRLQAEGIPAPVVTALRCVTKLTEDEDYDEFMRRAAANPVARMVKLADLEDNMNMLRITELRDRDLDRLRKYHRAWHWLSGQS
jgi:(p)ppGpp synthase/HD superfamily hydrolase